LGVQYPPLGFVQATFSESYTRSFIPNPLFPMTLKGYGNINATPVTVDGVLGLTFTPIAFISFDANAALGTGWDLLGEHGLAVIQKNTGSETVVAKSGLVFMGAATAALQFDFASIFPSDWTHVVLRSAHELKYRHFLGQKKGDEWIYQTRREHNGWTYKGNALIGYQFPAVPVLNMLAVQFEFSKRVEEPHLDKRFLSGIMMLDLTEKISLTMAAQYDFDKNADYRYLAALQLNIKLF
jgi:hypothetical protein